MQRHPVAQVEILNGVKHPTALRPIANNLQRYRHTGVGRQPNG